MNSRSGNGGRMMSFSNKSAFTMSQCQELEHQALIFNYILAALPIPSHLLLPIQNTFHSISHPSLSYCSLYGNKLDPELGRCRRTDGKKWRCFKEAYPDPKYCERHMHRGRNRSRKLVESKTMIVLGGALTCWLGTRETLMN